MRICQFHISAKFFYIKVITITRNIRTNFKLYRTNRDAELTEQKYSVISTGENEPPVPENPYAQLDNLLEDLKIPNPDGEPKLKARAREDHPYDDILTLRDQGPSEGGGYSGAAAVPSRKVNPVISKSSPFAVSNTSRSSSISSPVTESKLSRWYDKIIIIKI